LIKIKVTDDFEIKAVKLTIHNKDGKLEEEGNAKKNKRQFRMDVCGKNKK
jgi:hypothetical protein